MYDKYGIAIKQGNIYLYSNDGGLNYRQVDFTELPTELHFPMAIRECEFDFRETEREISGVLERYREIIAGFRRLSDKLLNKSN